jgi:hypothetical protein
MDTAKVVNIATGQLQTPEARDLEFRYICGFEGIPRPTATGHVDDTAAAAGQ